MLIITAFIAALPDRLKINRTDFMLVEFHTELTQTGHPIPTDRVVVWSLGLASFQGGFSLVEAEQSRLSRYKSHAVQRQFGITRTWLRLLLGQALQMAPLDVPIVLNAEGKPELPDEPLYFNVSHSENHAVIAIGPCPLGVDLEVVRPMPSADQMIQRFFEADEQAIYHALPPEKKLIGFFHGWTGKEAVLKGLGCGTRALHRCRVSLNPDEPSRILGPDDTRQQWQLLHFRPVPKGIAALAVQTGEELIPLLS